MPASLSQRVVWTLLPNGFNAETGRLKLSILVSPRLTLAPSVRPQNLSQFGDWTSWPEVIAGSTFTLSVDGGAPRPLSPTSKPDPGVWKALFPAETYVKPFIFTDLRGKAILSYPVATIAKGVEALYGRMALIAGDQLPSRRDLQPLMNAAEVSMGPKEVLRALRDEARRAPGGTSEQSPVRQPAAALSLLTTYHMPLSAEEKQSYRKQNRSDPRESATWVSAKRVDLPAPGDFKKLIDFHQIVASLAQYQDLNQLAGLVVSVEIEPGKIPDGDHTLQLGVNWPKSGAGGVHTDNDVIPPVMIRKLGTQFTARPRDAASPIAGRYLRLQGGGFDLVQMDVDGAALKLKNFATNLARGRPATYDDATFDDNGEVAEEGDGAPSLRSAGLMLAQERRDIAIQQLFVKNGDLNDNINAPPPLYAEDVIRGYRVDVRDSKTGRWRTLCSRRIDFGLANTGGAHTTPKEEGMVRLAAASSADGSLPDVLKIHEGLFAWKGWSLCAPEPGLVLQPDDSKVSPENDTAPDGLPLTTKFTATPTSLPSLRFGRSYKVRVRLVDLTGASADFDEGETQPAAAASNEVVYKRYEPVEAPSLALAKGAHGIETPAEGESMGRIAIRTFNDDPTKNTIAIKDRARRHLVPPRSTHRFAEQHGVMDTAAGKVDAALFATLANLDKPLDQVVVSRPAPPPRHVLGLPTPIQPRATIDTTFAVAPADFSLPFLPDPMAIGVAIKVEGVDGVSPDTIHKIPLYGAQWDPAVKPKWPNAQTFTVVAAETNLPDAKWFGDTREFVVPMKKGERGRLRVSSLIRTQDWQMMAVSWMILDQKPSPTDQTAIAQRIADGQHWMFTPWRTLELAHAVQKPLITPEFLTLQVERKLNNIAATPVYRLRLHGKTTARIDLMADWVEPLDDPASVEAKDGPVAKQHHAHTYDKPVARNEAPQDIYPSPKLDHVFGDTRYRRVRYTMDATTRYREFMPADIQKDPAALKVSSPAKTGWVANAAPPPPPKLLYVIPTFGWARHAGQGGAASLRWGGGLRVYLDRPWLASGFGEMLGVVLPPENPPSNVQFGTPFPADFDERPFITQWGRDPIWTSGRIFTAAPPKAAFPLARWRPPIPFDGTNIPAEEGTDLPQEDFKVDALPAPGLTRGLSVAPHAVGFDADRKLWYADIVVVPPQGAAYFPFVRLALARYHPVSVDGAHLSSVVMTEFQQLTPARLTIVTHPNGQTAHVAVYGTGVSASNASLPATGIFQAEAQVLDAGADADIGWRSAEPEGAAHYSLPSSTAHQTEAMLNRAPLALSGGPQAEVQKYLEAGDYQSLVNRPDLVQSAMPPVLWEGDVALPAIPPGGRRRILITEQEAYLTSPEAAPQVAGVNLSAPIRTRIVYLETLEV
jgi:hypothetical protein